MESQQHNALPVPPIAAINMDKLIEQLFERINRLEIDVRECHQNHKNTLELQNGAIVRALEQNTRALENIEKHLLTWQKRKAPVKRITMR